MKNPLQERIVPYRGKDIVVYFHVDRCTHVAECLSGLPEVFNTFQQPWVQPDRAEADRVARVILKCPTGALHFKRLDGGWEEEPPDTNRIIVIPDGPFYVSADASLVSDSGQLLLTDTRLALCRCGASRHSPFCDGMHVLDDFKDGPDCHSEPAGSSKPGRGKLTITVKTGFPYRVSGPVTVEDARNRLLFSGTQVALCSCGKSRKKPFCDGSHRKA